MQDFGLVSIITATYNSSKFVVETIESILAQTYTHWELLITDDGTVIRMPVDSISTLGRNTQGVRLMRVSDGSKVVCVARAEAEEEIPDDVDDIDSLDTEEPLYEGRSADDIDDIDDIDNLDTADPTDAENEEE